MKLDRSRLYHINAFNIEFLKFSPREKPHSGKSATIRESNHDSGVCKVHYALYYVPKISILLAGTGVWKISSIACGFNSIKIDFSDYLKINEVYVCVCGFFFNKISL